MSLADALRARIERDGPVSTRDFLAASLEAYYSRGRDIGAGGDFYTATNVSAFPRALARFVQGAVERLDGARVVELGGGTGALAAQLGTPLTVVEPHEGMAARQRERGLDVVPSLDALEPAPTVFLANEVVDALPVHRLVETSEGMRELHVDWRDGRFVETPGPLTRPELAQEAERLAPLLAQGCIVEVNLDQRALLAAMARAAPASFALIVDYGGTAADLYGPEHPRGTLRGYHQHRVADPFARPGEQDVTADVDFEALERDARDAGWHVGGRRPQGQLLVDLGLLDDMQAALAQGDMSGYLAAKNLMMPAGGMGQRFQALLLTRGVAPEPPLPGFRPDFMAGVGWR